MSKTKYVAVASSLLFVSALARAELEVEAGYVRASLPGSATTSAYMTLKNTGDAELIITKATSPAAGQVSFHSTMNHSGMIMMMGESSLKIAAHKALTLESGGTHLMLEKTPRPLVEGNMVELTLQTADGQRKTVMLPVKSVLNEK